MRSNADNHSDPSSSLNSNTTNVRDAEFEFPANALSCHSSVDNNRSTTSPVPSKTPDASSALRPAAPAPALFSQILPLPAPSHPCISPISSTHSTPPAPFPNIQ